MDLIQTLVRRLSGLPLVILSASLITFLVAHVIPSDPARMVAGEHASAAVVARIRHELALDQPLWIQYGRYLRQLAAGDLGNSVRSGQPVLSELLSALPATGELALAALCLTLLLGLSLGVSSAYWHGRALDRSVRVFSALSISTPTFWIGLLLLGLFFAELRWLPAGGRIDPEHAGVAHITGLYTLDALLDGDVAALIDALRHLAMPAITLALPLIGATARLVRAAMLDVMGEDQVRRARAAGLSEWVIVTRYALRLALIPFVTTLGLYLADLLSGAIVTEMIFSWPGLGSYAMQAIAGLDFPAIMAFTLFTSALYALANLLVDLLNLAIDPRARVGA